jgi:hypothetical protein
LSRLSFVSIGIVFKFVLSDFPEFCYLTVGQQVFLFSEKLCGLAIEPVSKLEDTDKASELKEFSPEATLAV